MNVRLSGSQTVARPEFRELAPFLFSDFVGGIIVQGQPGLKTADIWNADLRWEWFPSAEEVVAASVFFKYFDDPIERTIRPGTSNLVSSFRNAKSAYNIGAELELRKNLEFISKRMRDLSVGMNFAYVYSRVRLAEQCDVAVTPDCEEDASLDVSTSRRRPLQGQAPLVANAYIDYDNEKSGTNVRLLYNAVLANIAFVGGMGLPDIYLQPIHQLDFVGRQRVYKGLSVTLMVTNMLNWGLRWRQRQGDQTVTNYEMRPGATIWLGLAVEL
jgi:outer membrane receptor protein involved in Fe transport